VPSPSYDTGITDGFSWGFNRAWGVQRQQLESWFARKVDDLLAARVRCRDVVDVIFPDIDSKVGRQDIEKLLQGDNNYASGFVEGALQAWRKHDEIKAEKKNSKTKG
jgi:hypothetical protein